MPERFWCISYSDAVAEYVDRLCDEDPPELKFINNIDVREYVDSLGSVAGGYRRYDVISTDLSGMPRPRLRITDPNFSVDMFNQGLDFVSARFAQFLNLNDSEVQYIEADCGQCPASVQAMGYRVLNPRAFANPMDRQRMAGVFIDVALPSGGSTYVWSPDPPRPGWPGPPTYWREDFVPPAPLFKIPGMWTAVTDALADRIMRAGFQDLMFIDYAADTGGGGRVRRQLAD
jgi:hypothetical protein